MDIVSASLLVAVFATVGMALVLLKHLMFKRELLKLKEDMKQHHLKHGFDNDLWIMFTEKTRKMLKFRR